MEKIKLNPISSVLLIIFLVILGITFTENIKSTTVNPTPANLITSTNTASFSSGETSDSTKSDDSTTSTQSSTSGTSNISTTTTITPTTTTTSTTDTTTPTSSTTPTTITPTTTTTTTTSSTTSTITTPSTTTTPETSPTTTSILTTSESSSKIQDLGTVIEERTNTVDDSKEKLVEIINESVTDIIENDENLEQETDTAEINILRDELLKNVDASLPIPSTVTPADINNLKTEINKGIEDINKTATENTPISPTKDTSLEDVATTLNLLSEAVSAQSKSLRKQEADLLYKDSNQDGVSDYDSMYVYNLDPALPSPVSVYEGRGINASEKILLGLDPARSEIVAVNKEQPLESEALIILTYKVEEVALTEKKEIIFKGQALPNSFITLYIYSTPIIVTVKTDERGEWQYVLDKELENGDHTIYTATVNNSGNIIARSSPFLFTKTAEAATLKDVPFMESSIDTNKPGLLEGNNLYIIIAILLAIIIMALILIGMTNKKSKEEI